METLNFRPIFPLQESISSSLRSLRCLRRRHARHRSQTCACVVSTLQWITSQTGRWKTATGIERNRERERDREGKGKRVEGDRQIRKIRSDFAFFSFRDILYLHFFTEAAHPSVAQYYSESPNPCQIGERDTLFGDCTRTLLSPSGVSEET